MKTSKKTPLDSDGIIPPPVAFELPSDWHVFGPVSKDRMLPRERLMHVPEWIEHDGEKVFPQHAVAIDGGLDLAPLIGGAVADKGAYVFIPFTCTHDVEVRLGFGADFWFDAYLDGESICDNLESGNWNYPPTATDYIEQVSLTKGRHLLAIRFISGGGTSMLRAAVYHGQGKLAHATHQV